MNVMPPLGLFGPTDAPPSASEAADAELAVRLRADHSGQLRRDLLLQLDSMQVDLRTQAGRGADGEAWKHIEAGLAAVAAAREILNRMPAAESQPPAGVLPAASFRSTP
jgi:hypothetical protein